MPENPPQIVTRGKGNGTALIGGYYMLVRGSMIHDIGAEVFKQ